MPHDETPLAPDSLPHGVRRGEGMVRLRQSDAERAVTILEMNEKLDALLGYAPGEMVGRKLETILGRKDAGFIADELEFIEGAPDIGDVLAKLRELRLRRRSGEEVRVEYRIARMVAEGGLAHFQLVIPNEQERTAAHKLRDFIALNLEGRQELDIATGLANRGTANVFLPLLKTYLSESDMSVACAVIRLDRYQKSLKRYGETACVSLMRHIANCCRSSFRADDMLFSLSPQTLGVVLFDIGQDSARVVLNRLRWKIRSHRIDFSGKSDFSTTVSVSFVMLQSAAPEDVIRRCEEAVMTLDVGERNALLELDTA